MSGLSTGEGTWHWEVGGLRGGGVLDCGGWDLGAATGRAEPRCDGDGDWGGWSEPQTVARGAMEGRIVVGSGGVARG